MITLLFLAFDTFYIAIKYLETQKKAHRDISYTNILLRETDDSDAGRANREKVMQELGLSEIEELRMQLKCREGLLIDFDYGAVLAGLAAGEKTNSDEREKETDSGERQGEVLQTSHSGARTVSNSNSMPILHLLRHLAGYSSFHRTGVASLRSPSSCRP